MKKSLAIRAKTSLQFFYFFNIICDFLEKVNKIFQETNWSQANKQ